MLNSVSKSDTERELPRYESIQNNFRLVLQMNYKAINFALINQGLENIPFVVDYQLNFLVIERLLGDSFFRCVLTIENYLDYSSTDTSFVP